jgi:hypothetical protein
MHSLVKGNHRRIQGYHLLMIKDEEQFMQELHNFMDMVQTSKSQSLLGDNGSKNISTDVR